MKTAYNEPVHNNVVDPDFDRMFSLEGDMRHFQRAPRGIPHCDCEGANRQAGRRLDPQALRGYIPFELVPTSSHDGRHCDHCGYVAPLMPAQAQALDPEAAAAELAALAAIEPGQGVIGLNVTTGEVLRFPSAIKASKAGYGTIQYALTTGRTVKGHMWLRAGGA